MKSPVYFLSLLPMLAATVGCQYEKFSTAPETLFPRDNHSLLPDPEGHRAPVGRWELGTSMAAPQQPLAYSPSSLPASPLEYDASLPSFNHSIHAASAGQGGLAMDCQYCHSSARRSIHAGVPTTQVCMNCHQYINDADRPVLQNLKAWHEAGLEDPSKTIPWVKVHDTSDFVYFNHAPHVSAGVACQDCHGPMETRGVAVRVSSLEMGWCLECHQNHPSVDANYGADAELRRAELKDCYTCHK